MDKLSIIAKIEVKEDKLDLVKKELIKLLEPTRKEEGCLEYNLYQDFVTPSKFVFVELWENRTLWQEHMKGKPLMEYEKATEGAIESFEIIEMKRIEK